MTTCSVFLKTFSITCFTVISSPHLPVWDKNNWCCTAVICRYTFIGQLCHLYEVEERRFNILTSSEIKLWWLTMNASKCKSSKKCNSPPTIAMAGRKFYVKCLGITLDTHLTTFLHLLHSQFIHLIQHR